MFCRQCGNEVPDGAKFCGKCGQAMPQVSVTDNADSPKKNTGKVIAIVIILSALVLSFGILAWVILDKFTEEERDKEPKEQTEEKGEDDSEKLAFGNDENGEALAIATLEPAIPVETEMPEATPQPTPQPTTPPLATMPPAPTTEPNAIHEYVLVVEDVTWTQASQKCREWGGYLVNIDSDEEYQYILELIEENGRDNVIWWLGACRQNNSFDYNWVRSNGYLSEVIINEDEMYDEYWMDGEPSYYDGNLSEQYINMFYRSSEGRYVWNDVVDDVIGAVASYSGKVGYICEIESGILPDVN